LRYFILFSFLTISCECYQEWPLHHYQTTTEKDSLEKANVAEKEEHEEQRRRQQEKSGKKALKSVYDPAVVEAMGTVLPKDFNTDNPLCFNCGHLRYLFVQLQLMD
jgi:hypothetical protein